MKKGTQLKSLFCAITLLFSLQAKLQIITTVAGNGISAYWGDGGPAIYASFATPFDVKLDKYGNMYIVDEYNSRIRKVMISTGIITTIAGIGTAGFSGDGGPATEAEINMPTGIAVDSLGNVFIADTKNHRIRKIDASSGIISTICGNGNSGSSGDGGSALNATLGAPVGVALDATSTILYITDDQWYTIRKVDLSTGIISRVAGKIGYDYYDGDEKLAINSSLHPWAIAIDSANNIYVTDLTNQRIRKITASTGIIHTVAGNGTIGFSGDGGLATLAQIGYPWGIALDRDNNIFISDWWSAHIRKVNQGDSIITTIAGTGGIGFNGDGILATDAAIGQPYGMSTDVRGNLFFVTGNIPRVRKITMDSSLLNQIHGYAYYDLNSNNQKDDNENLFPGGKVVIDRGTDSIVSMSTNGDFRIGVDTGNFVASFLPPNDYYKAVPATHPFSFTEYNKADSVYFALQPVAGKRDLFVNMYSLGGAIPGYGANFEINYQNNGTDTVAAGFIQLIADHRLVFDSASAAVTSISGDTIRWNFSNLKPLDKASVLVYFSLPPANASIGDTLYSLATANPIDGDLTPVDDSSAVMQIVKSSFDPNDKAENHGGFIAQKDVLAGDYLTYTIRFQNTGTAAANNIVVKDTLDKKLDWNSLQMISSSHNCQLLVSNGNDCVWTFSNILLPDSNTNEAASHGYVVYRIKAKSSLKVGDVIKNTASIYFDYNAPVQTNTEKTKVVGDVVLPLQLVAFTAKNNGSTNLLQWSTAQEINTDRFEVQRSINSRDFVGVGTVKTMNNGKTKNDYSFTDALPLKGKNYYRLKITDRDGKFVYSAVRSLNVTGAAVTVYPNPAKDILKIAGIDALATTRVMIIDMRGNVVMKKVLTDNNSINIQALAAGVYKINFEINGELHSVKFVKE